MKTGLQELLERYPQLSSIHDQLTGAADLLAQSVSSKGTILVCGNGGSAADADHIVGELMKRFVRERPIDKDLQESLKKIDPVKGAMLATSLEGSIPAICLSAHTALSTAFGNDVDSAISYAQQVSGYGVSGDVFWGLSTSGNAKNVLYAAIVAKAKGLKVLGMTGEGGGLLKDMCDVCIRVPEKETFKVQELHLPIYHWLCIYLESLYW
ncbi:MAG: SIS domain-containing protein [Sphaerochaeta sp.]|nr:SIS domain-containing protein [Sphaerochaeta sp.]HKL58631.1 SIS domain-containing protein [Sphaerochaeta sp.]